MLHSSLPGRGYGVVAQDGNSYFVSDPRNKFLPGGFVTTDISDDGLTIINSTDPVWHVFDGQITRTAHQGVHGQWYVETIGTGDSMLDFMDRINESQGVEIFNRMDFRMANYIIEYQ